MTKLQFEEDNLTWAPLLHSDDEDGIYIEKLLHVIRDEISETLNDPWSAEERRDRLMILDMGVNKYIQEWIPIRLSEFDIEWEDEFELSHSVHINQETDDYIIRLNAKRKNPSLYYQDDRNYWTFAADREEERTISESRFQPLHGPVVPDMEVGRISADTITAGTIDASHLRFDRAEEINANFVVHDGTRQDIDTMHPAPEENVAWVNLPGGIDWTPSGIVWAGPQEDN